ncbi:MAG: CDF family Co(II)/Ni(II) efflux transporter DmeF [Nitrospira sp. SB0677_bin_15]|nr:CDF family Co(II)/Ni(II) efflux transporter DmeF [Nitrospira sp. SB0667_bin_9]MYD31454.1 CDF family Co(II)/Ni(II) efflux transporter DmeF [Nitrospira sp. SB0661_bin_20]MYG40689.1 CDF family Co(II)/Ni(II) efflux transporter DmeF [Nitrospira sp. SB0677_bin_15]MYH01326.1 CDF family Co(II)/Ni(II) efflux transporter DmeF [Nitrospira sp. SB0675_bin_23]MYJ22584.1 CDF family Co(II)/Ni(II) efflux transporter DmeF [Nitrospira sp. SB0673_bin_12]
MHRDDVQAWQHSHTFGQDLKRPGERRTLLVIAVTGTMMVVEIVAGILTGSMALLADGLHMASHAGALSLNAFAYVYSRRHARDEDFSFGAGKVNALGGFTGAVLLALFALLMAWESMSRLLHPVPIIVDQAILVAVLGLAVNGASVFILRVDDRPERRDLDDFRHSHHDHNLKAAYLHVLADALTSLLAIAALLSAKYLGLTWMDPVVGIIGAILVSSWSFGLLRTTSGILLDKQGPKSIRDRIRNSLEADEDSRVTDLHLWSIGPNIFSVVITIVAHDPATPAQYKERIPTNLGLVHIAIEVHACPSRRKMN